MLGEYILNPSLDAALIKQLDNELLRTHYVKIIVMNREETPLRTIQGKVSSGSISINGSSSVRRTGNISFLPEDNETDLENINNLLSINKRIKILVGLDNNIDKTKPAIVWYNLGVFIVTQPSINHSTTGTTIQLSLKDKMCLLNGECGGGLPASVTFDSYDQIYGEYKLEPGKSHGDIANPSETLVYRDSQGLWIWSQIDGWAPASESMIGSVVSIKQKIFDIVQTAVVFYGGESVSNVFIDGIPLELKQSVRYTGSDVIYYNNASGRYSKIKERDEGTSVYTYNNDLGYIFTDFVFPGQLVTNIGDSVTSVLDKICSTLGNYEYFYDVEGHFIFQEKKNYLNTTYDPFKAAQARVLDKDNYQLDFSNYGKSTYTFKEGNGLVASYSNSPNYLKVKNDFHIWGKNSDGYAIHYHVAVKNKPLPVNEKGYYAIHNNIAILKNEYGEDTKKVVVSNNNCLPNYRVKDWRAELYLQGLEKQKNGIRPDMYEQEILDLFPFIFDFTKEMIGEDGEKYYGDFISNCVNDYTYWIDYIEPDLGLLGISVDAIGPRQYAYQEDGINKIWATNIPDIVMINLGDTSIKQERERSKCDNNGYRWANVDAAIMNETSIGIAGYDAQTAARTLLYQYTKYNESISLSTMPIYYLEPNTRITVSDRMANLDGDYVINSITVPLDGRSTMSISAEKALERV